MSELPGWQLRQALLDGRRAEPLATNAYYGHGELAVAWRTGYMSRINNGRTMRAYYAAHPALN